MEVHAGLYSPLSLTSTPSCPRSPKARPLSGQEMICSELGGGSTGFGQGVLGQGDSVNPSLGVSKNVTKKF